MKRSKGQYLAVESVLTFGMALFLAIGTVKMFNDYQNQVVSTAEGRQVITVESRVTNAMYSIQPADNAEITVNLPRTIGGEQYEMGLNKGLHIFLSQAAYHRNLTELTEQGYSFTGTAQGGTVKIFKRGNKYSLRPG